MSTREKTVRARQLRRAMTMHEVKLWAFLRDGQIAGCSFRRQHPVGPYFLDFYCAAMKLAVELDGSQHGTAEAQDYDESRTRFLSRKGIQVLRFWNHELNDNFEGVLEGIRRALTTAPTRPAAPGTLPLSGGGKEQRQHH
jgi:very-short-patch-repair endonuclease